jgi:hypothetical protein
MNASTEKRDVLSDACVVFLVLFLAVAVSYPTTVPKGRRGSGGLVEQFLASPVVNVNGNANQSINLSFLLISIAT